ncbi:type II toxin-antitoxin system antitoxin SocA domain-containing protein [uncultured Treponema sp.]|uniref:Panacea domain-containing protein n=1 Tax=uncultured Treponema sp. TaxID=162155 RepID=UPI00280AFB6D|nr:type II toxin-antitoxin system antitoxin SocA domain-containing protein [uncultured Treponema sp.]
MIGSVDFAKFILKTAREKSLCMNQTKLQKILYICDGTLLALGKNVINENAKAWDYGPVYPKVYRWFQKHKDDNFLSFSIPEEILADNDIKKIVSQALDKFGSWTAKSLSEWSHKSGSPWSATMEQSNGKLNSAISKDYMKLYFTGLLGV